MRALPEIKLYKLDTDEHDVNTAIKKDTLVQWHVVSTPPKPGKDIDWSIVARESPHVVVPMFKIKANTMDLVGLGVALGAQLPEAAKEVRILWRQLNDDALAIGIAAKE